MNYRSLSEEYNTLEEGTEKKPCELFHFWCGSSNWYLTNYDEKVLFRAVYYEPVAIKRGVVEYNTDINVSKLNIEVGAVSKPVLEFVSMNPVDIMWVQVLRKFMDQEDDEAAVIFIGQIKTVSFKGQIASAECVGFEYYLRQPIPKERYQPQCNHKVFDIGCSLDDTDYKVSDVTVTVDATKRILTAVEFGAQEDGYWVFGRVEYSGRGRMIIAHEGNSITLSYPLYTLPSSGGNVDIWPGCDGNIKTCRDKFDNVINFLGFPYMPFDNPALWV